MRRNGSGAGRTTSVSQRDSGHSPPSPAVDSCRIPPRRRRPPECSCTRGWLRGVGSDDAELGLGAEHVTGGLVILLRVLGFFFKGRKVFFRPAEIFSSGLVRQGDVHDPAGGVPGDASPFRGVGGIRQVLAVVDLRRDGVEDVRGVPYSLSGSVSGGRLAKSTLIAKVWLGRRYWPASRGRSASTGHAGHPQVRSRSGAASRRKSSSAMARRSAAAASSLPPCSATRSSAEEEASMCLDRTRRPPGRVGPPDLHVKRPGRKMAGSMSSSRFDAPLTMTSVLRRPVRRAAAGRPWTHVRGHAGATGASGYRRRRRSPAYRRGRSFRRARRSADRRSVSPTNSAAPGL